MRVGLRTQRFQQPDDLFRRRIGEPVTAEETGDRFS
jgi:hypothetical protein